MDHLEPSAAIYSEAKSEYTRQLVCNFQPVLLRFFLERFQETKTNAKTKSVLSEFQESLSLIPEWNMDKVTRETAKLLTDVATTCDYTEDLITAVFIAHTKILSAIRLQSKPRRRINITVPKPEHFMHRTLSECSRLLWSHVYLFNETGTSLDRQKNMTEVNRLLEEGVLQAVRNLLPVKTILRDSLQDDDSDAIHIQNGGHQNEEKEEEKEDEKEDKQEEEPVKEEKPKEEAKTPTITKLGEEESTVKPVMDLTNVELLAPTPPLTTAPLSIEPPAVPPVATTTEVAGGATPVTPASQTLVVDTERSVAFTGMDTVFGLDGAAEIQPMNEEHDDADEDLRILGDAGGIDADDFEDLDAPLPTPEPLAVGDYEVI